jgi:hypothetical protein
MEFVLVDYIREKRVEMQRENVMSSSHKKMMKKKLKKK